MKKKKRRVDLTGQMMKWAPYEETYESDGIKYRITVEYADDNFWGKWYCTQCGARGGSSKACNSRKQAVTYAKTNLSTHHILKHAPTDTKSNVSDNQNKRT